MKRILLIIIPILCMITSCNKSDSSSSKEQPSPPTTEGSGDPDAIPLPAAGTGQLQFSIDADSDPATIEGYVVGNQEKLKIANVGDTFYINDIPPGQQDIVITAGTVAIKTALTSGNDRGVRKNEIGVTADSVTSLNQVTIPIAGSISGIVKRKGAADHSGIDIFIPGTSYIAKSDVDGKFSMTNVPVGTHKLQFKTQSFNDVLLEDENGKPNIEVASAANSELDPVEMIPTVVQGFLKIAACDCLNTDETLPLVKITATSDAFQMRLSKEPNFIGVQFEPFVAEFALPAAFELQNGENHIYLQLQDKTGVAGAITKNTIVLGGSGAGGTAAVPTSDVLGGNFTTAKIVTLTGETDAVIYFTLDGSTPTSTSTLYTDPIRINCNGSKTLKALSVVPGKNNSEILSLAFAFTDCPIMIYPTKLTYQGNLGGPAGAKTKCEADLPAELSCNGVYPWLSTGGTMKLGDIPTTASPNFTATRPVYGYKAGEVGVPFYAAYSNCSTGSLVAPLVSMATATGITANYWTGTELTGVASNSNCVNWSDSGSVYGKAGDRDTIGVGFVLDSSTPLCSVAHHIMCLCY